jgi:hypothetical protein
MVQGKIKPEGLDGVEEAARKMFAALDEAQPEGVRYASCRLPDGETFVALIQVDEGVENPVPEFPEFKEFYERVEAARATPAMVEPLDVIGSYRLF